MTIKHITLNDPDSRFTFSACTIAGDTIYTSHIAGFFDDQGDLIEGTAAQTAQCFRNLGNILAAAGATLDNVVKVTVLLKDMKDFEEMREIYREMFSAGYPARTTATSHFVDPRCRVQIEAVAYKPRE